MLVFCLYFEVGDIPLPDGINSDEFTCNVLITRDINSDEFTGKAHRFSKFNKY